MSLHTLPTNKDSHVSEHDMQLADSIFGKIESENFNRGALANYLKTPALVAVLVGLALHPLSDELIRKVYPNSEGYSMMAIKMAIVALLFYFINNWALSRA